jgi:hypothetical protein
MAVNKVKALIARGMASELAAVAGVSSVKADITAAGTVITDATDLEHELNVITTAAASTGVQLPDYPIGSAIEVHNRGANTVNVFPHSSTGTIQGGGGGSAQTIASNKHGVFKRVTALDWAYTLLN